MVAALAACQGLLVTNNITVISIGSLAGLMLAADKSLSTLPATAHIAGGALASFPISLYMKRRGRCAGFTLGALAGLTGALICTLSLAWHGFWLFFGALWIMAAGVLTYLVCLASAVTGQTVPHFRVSGTLLGVGWCFLHVGATTLLTDAYAPPEKAKTQGINDSCSS
jgi:hypothetical protein